MSHHKKLKENDYYFLSNFFIVKYSNIKKMPLLPAISEKWRKFLLSLNINAFPPGSAICGFTYSVYNY